MSVRERIPEWIIKGISANCIVSGEFQCNLVESVDV